MIRQRLVWVGLSVVATTGLLACGSSAPSRSELVAALEASGIPSARAACAADAVLENLSDEEVVELVERGPAGAPRDDPDRTDDSSDEVRAALAACREVGPTTTAAPTSTTPANGSGNGPANGPGPSSTTASTSTTGAG